MNYIVLTLFIVVLCSNGNNSLELSYIEKFESVTYLTYTKANPKNSVDIRDVDFNDNFSNVFIIHGFDAKSLEKPLQVKDHLFQYDEKVKRVIVIDWLDYSKGTAENAYDNVARDYVPLLAEDVYEKILHIRKNGAKIIELIGHSVGSHVAGQTGKLLGNEPVDKIYGLDPAGRYFADRQEFALEAGDANNVLVFHTNINGYGYGSEIGTNDRRVNGGELQPNCKVNEDFCSHNEAWNAYSQYLRDQTINKEEVQIHPYVICLDVSGSMVDNKRLTRAVHSTREAISNLKSGTFIGIVKFNEAAKTIHNIIEIKGEADKISLQESLPTESSGSTSIGAGLRLSINMLNAMPNITQFCSTILLISDGEQMVGEAPRDVLKDLQNGCIKINSIALGRYASKDLEELSSSTKGEVSYAMEDGSGQELVGTMRAFSFMFESQMSTDDVVHLPSKEITLTAGEDEVHYIIDDTTGKNTEFKYVSYEIDQLDVKLTSPNGKVFTSSSSEYFYDDFAQKGFRISEAMPGSWKFIVTKTSKRKRSVRSTASAVSVTAVGKTHQRNEVPAIRLGAVVSDRVLTYPKPITVSAELRSGAFPIINAEVFANIRAPNSALIQLAMHDNGIFPDELANDGIYTTDIKKLPKPERYTVIVTARSNGTAILVPEKIDYFLKDVGDCRIISCQKLNEFEREADAGSIKLSSKKNEDKIPPRKVGDLRGMIENEREKLVGLEWTSPNDEFYDIKINHYDIRALINGTNFKNGVKLIASNVVEGSLDVDKSTTTKVEKIVIKVPDHIWNYIEQDVRSQYRQLKFALKSVGLNGAISERSNIASVILKEKPVKEDPVNVKIIFEEKDLFQKKDCKTILYEHRIGNFTIKFC